MAASALRFAEAPFSFATDELAIVRWKVSKAPKKFLKHTSLLIPDKLIV
jgi:hypothetical protein